MELLQEGKYHEFLHETLCSTADDASLEDVLHRMMSEAHAASCVPQVKDTFDELVLDSELDTETQELAQYVQTYIEEFGTKRSRGSNAAPRDLAGHATNFAGGFAKLFGGFGADFQAVKAGLAKPTPYRQPNKPKKEHGHHKPFAPHH
eukprot:TRINITY_DN86751_c0_g1_i1.p1 TRINITY_DN86751_c0_g1~~TRINITY_DN86751_c0_g1_i1.p1  ORF type:complete len:155 (+),score=23.83 TRINITY_DN86751_c0_g1_i1:24-467(+)